MSPDRRLAQSAAVFAWSLLGLACRTGPLETDQAENTRSAKTRVQLDVFAAASLREAFTDLERDFEAKRDTDVVLHFAGSQELRIQIEQGAQADVFASADRSTIEKLESGNRVRSSRNFARNTPVIVVAQSARDRIQTLADLPEVGRLVIGVPEVPIGRYTEAIIERASARYGPDFSDRFSAAVVSKELNVKQVLAKVRLGEANAGIVYRTDVASDPSVATREIPPELNVIGDYSLAILRQARHLEEAKAWVELAVSRAGQDVLLARGFLPAEPGL